MNKQLSTRDYALAPFSHLGFPIFNSLFTDPLGLMKSSENSPHMRTVETDGGREYVYTIPGTPNDAIDVQVEGEFLKVEVSSNEEDWHSSLLSRVRLPGDADKEKINARYEHGVLTVFVPFIEKEKRTIPVEYIASDDKAIEAG